MIPRFSRFVVAFLHGLAPGMLLADKPFPTSGLLPKDETGALRFLESYPEYDGKGVRVAIFDSGVDPGVEGLQKTPDGRPKIVDLIDGTGSGDVDTSVILEAEDGKLTGLSGRTLLIDPAWQTPSGRYHLGIKAAWELFPSSLVQRLKKERQETFERTHRQLLAQVLSTLLKCQDDKEQKKECEAQLKELQSAMARYEDPGPVYDCVVYHDGDNWRAAIDTDEDGDFSDEKSLTDYHRERQFGSFGKQAHAQFAVNIYEDGNLLSIVVESNMHGTHVAGIVAGYYPGQPELNGIAPGAQIVSVKIGDSRLDGMETGTGIVRGLHAVKRHRCQLINMSYGEPTRTPNQGRLVRLISELVREEDVLFVASAGNAGPALSTVGAPGGTSTAVIGVGAYVTPAMMEAGYSMRATKPPLAYTWSSRGPTADGDWGVNICAPGGALSPVPNWTLRRNRYANGTSMSSPNACGAMALLVSGLLGEKIAYSADSVRRAIENTAAPVSNRDPFGQGQGLVQIDRAFDLLKSHPLPEEPRFDVRLPGRDGARGLYLREQFESTRKQIQSVSVTPRFSKGFPNAEKLHFNRRLALTSTAKWLEYPDHLLLTNRPAAFEIAADPTMLEHGVHTAELLATDPSAPDQGPVFRLPATVIRPHLIDAGTGFSWQTSNDLSPGEMRREFFAVPQGATWLEATLTSRSELPQKVIAHFMQVLPHRRHPESGKRLRLTLSPKTPIKQHIAVTGGRTLEVVLASDWSAIDPLAYDLKLQFHGVTSDTKALVLSESAPAQRLVARSMADSETLAPSGKLTEWECLILPKESRLRPLSERRDQLWNGDRVNELVLTYPFSLTTEAEVIPWLPSLNHRLYESEVQSQVWMIHDANKRRIAVDDGWEPHAVALPKGKYVVTYHLRHEDASKLERWKKVPLSLRGTLSGSVSLKAHRTQSGALYGENGINSIAMAKEGMIDIYWAAPKPDAIPKLPLQAHQLIGTFALMNDQPQPSGRLYYQLTQSESEKSKDHRPEDHPLQELADALAELDDVPTRKTDHGKIVDQCDRIIAKIDQDALARHRGQRYDADDKECQRYKREFEILTDTLYRKCRAIAYHDGEREKAGESFDSEPFETAFADLKRWVDTTQPEFVLAHIRWHRRHQRYGQALALLEKHMQKAEPTKLLLEKRVKILRELDWEIWADHEEQWNRLHLPGAYPPF